MEWSDYKIKLYTSSIYKPRAPTQKRRAEMETHFRWWRSYSTMLPRQASHPNNWHAAMLHVVFTITTRPTAGHDLHPSWAIRWLINARTRTKSRNELPECIVMRLNHNWMAENKIIKKNNNHINQVWKSVILSKELFFVQPQARSRRLTCTVITMKIAGPEVKACMMLM